MTGPRPVRFGGQALAWCLVLALALAPAATGPAAAPAGAPPGDTNALDLSARWPLLADASTRTLAPAGGERVLARTQRRAPAPSRRLAPRQRARALAPARARSLAELGRRQTDGG